MITLRKLKIYQQFSGDGDHYTRLNSNTAGQIIESIDFFTINGLLQDVEIIEKKLSSPTYVEAVSRKIVEICDSAETIDELKRMAKPTNVTPLKTDSRMS
jgi:hypothetical protein